MLEYPGLYRGIVKENDDSEEDHPYLGRVKVFVPQVHGDTIKDEDLPWAWPCSPMGGGRPGAGSEKIGHGFIAVPPVGSSVWIAFEHGDPANPVWLGTWYGQKDANPEMPDEALEDSPLSSVVYPDIFLIKPPFFKDGMYIKIVKDQRIEIVLEKTKTFLSFNKSNDTIWLRSETGNIDVVAGEGSIRLTSGEDPNQSSIVMNSATGEVSIDAVAFRVNAETVSFNDTNFSVSSSGATRNGSPAASGWENHIAASPTVSIVDIMLEEAGKQAAILITEFEADLVAAGKLL